MPVLNIRNAAIAATLALALLTGCRSKEDQAVDQAKAQAAQTGQTQQVQFVDSNGDTVTNTVQPGPTPQSQPTVTRSVQPPPPGVPKPKQTDPILYNGSSPQPPQYSAATTPATNPAVTTPAPYPASTAPSTGPDPNAPYNEPPPTPNAPALNLNVPAGTTLAIRINQHISVKGSRAGDHFSGEVVDAVVENGTTLIPRGTPVAGRVDISHKRGHFKGASELALRLTSMEINGARYAINTHDSVRTKKGKGKRSSAFIGGLTGAGMLIGGLAGGGKGLLIGGASGAGAGTLIAGTTGNRDIDLPAESVVRFRLSEPLSIP